MISIGALSAADAAILDALDEAPESYISPSSDSLAAMLGVRFGSRDVSRWATVQYVADAVGISPTTARKRIRSLHVRGLVDVRIARFPAGVTRWFVTAGSIRPTLGEVA